MVSRLPIHCGLFRPALATAALPWAVAVWLCVAGITAATDCATIAAPATTAGYLARLLINENPFPGERGYVSVEDSKAGMRQVLWVLHSRMHYIPPGYTQAQIASVRSQNILDVITAKNQCEGFYRDPRGNPSFAPRVEERLNYLKGIANKGGKPGKFAELLNYGQGLATAYDSGGIGAADLFAGVSVINRTPVTGRAYSWMTDRDCYKPGGNFVAIPDAQDGSPGGNRFFTLRKEPK
jgi:hypothetical protein